MKIKKYNCLTNTTKKENVYWKKKVEDINGLEGDVLRKKNLSVNAKQLKHCLKWGTEGKGSRLWIYNHPLWEPRSIPDWEFNSGMVTGFMLLLNEWP